MIISASTGMSQPHRRSFLHHRCALPRTKSPMHAIEHDSVDAITKRFFDDNQNTTTMA
jgi:hypothetical protein